MTNKIKTSEEQKTNYSSFGSYTAFAVDFFWGNHFTIKRIEVSSEVGTRPIGAGAKVNGQIIESEGIRIIRFTASIRLGWFLVFIFTMLISTGFGGVGLVLGLMACFCTYLILRNLAIADFKNIDIEIYKSLKAK